MSFAFSCGCEQDIGPVKRLLAECGLPGEDIDPHIAHFVIARAGGELAGAIGLELAGKTALLRSLGVSERYRGQGLGTQLYERVHGFAHAEGVETLYLLTTSASGFFRKRGFTAAERAAAPQHIAATREFAALCPDTAAFMMRSIRHEVLTSAHRA